MKKSITDNYHAKPHSLFYITVIFGFFLSVFQCPAHAWTVSATWESFSVGSTACDGNIGSGDGLTGDCGSQYTVTSAYAHSGSKSMQIYVKKGQASTGMPTFTFPSRIYEGGEIWGRYYLYVPTGFDWTAEYIAKLFRYSVSDSSGNGQGYISILETSPHAYGCSGGSTWGYIVGGAEYTRGYYNWSDTYVCQTHGSGHWLTEGRWHQLELYVKASSTGAGTFRLWHDGTLIWEKTNIQTIPPNGWIGEAPTNWYVNHFMGWWNQGGTVPTKDQYLYVDDFIYTNQRPSITDAFGNYMIGPPPKQPLPPSKLHII